jgi:superfamily II DNA/RNA helicase
MAHVEAAYTPVHTFLDFGFDRDIVESLTKRGYEIPTRIQDGSIPHILAGKDVVGIANTGSGKTAAFVLPIIQKLKNQQNKETVLIITPTRELAQQIQGELRQFTGRIKLYSTLCVGGLNIRAQIRELRRGAHVVIGTPGRLKDLIERNELRLDQTTTLVLDEADRMLDMGFLPDIRFIISKLPKKRQSLCFSATTAPEVTKLMDQMLVNPVTVSVRTSMTGEHIAQDIIKARSKEEKMKELTEMLAKDHFEKVLIFGEMKFSVQKLADELTKLGFPAVAIHGNKSQPQRQRALDSFKAGKVNILVATDVAARGLDIPNVSHVINFDQPHTHEDYVHRIGRTGRAGKPGQAYTFVN